MGPRALLLLLALLAGEPALAAQLLHEVIQHGSSAAAAAEAAELEVLLGFPARLTTGFSSTDDRTFRAQIATDADTGPWQFAELRFDESGYDVEHVSIEGARGRGFTLEFRFRNPMAVVTLPQYADNRLAVKYLPAAEQRRATSRATRRADDESGWAVELTGAGPLLRLDELPRAWLLNRTLYLAPGAGAAGPRLGFFPAAKARSVLADVRGSFPAARIVPVSPEEAGYGERMRLNSSRIGALYSPAGPALEPAAAPRISIVTASGGAIPDAEPATTSRLIGWKDQVDDSLLRQAKSAYIAGDYPAASALYEQAAELAPFRFEALEMLGVTREQMREPEAAKRAYQTALAEFPARSEADRIRARLTALETVEQPPRALRRPSRTRSSAWQSSLLLSQFYRRYSLDIDRQDRTIPIDGLFSDLDLDLRRSGEAVNHEARVAVGHVQDFAAAAGNDDVRVQALYWESSVAPLRTSVRVGRQTEHRAGVLGRFDGIVATHSLSGRADLQAVGGYLLDSSYQSPATERPFWGLNAEFTLLDDTLSLVPFFVQQSFDGVVDRQAVGLQGELYTDGGSYFGRIDYDLHHQALNHALLSANLNWGASTRISGSVDHRRSPYLTTRNALIGQAVDDLSELELLLVEERLEDIAADRSAVSTFLRLGIDHRFGAGWALSLDSSLMDFAATDTSANVAGLPAHRDYALSAQIRSDNAFGRGNFGALQMRYYRSDTTTSTGAYLHNRFGLWQDWWLYPRLAVDRRTLDTSGEVQLRVKPSLRLDYRHSRRFLLQLEAGYEWTTRETVLGDLDMRGLFIMAGYRLVL